MSGRVISERWLAEKLAGITHSGVAVKVYRHPAPSSAVYPFISVAVISAVDLYQMGPTIGYERLQYSVRVWDNTSSAAKVNAIAKEIHRRINAVQPEFYQDGYVVSCNRVGAIAPDVVEEQNGDLFYADGGIYRIHVVTYSE
jgi:hypothetical protein